MGYKILSLDGGGSWALIQARILQDLYGDISGHELLKKFDMVIANSGGSLVLACLCNNMSPGEIVSVFQNQEKRKQIFSKLKANEHSLLSFLRSVFKNLSIGPKYSAERKRKGLVAVLSEYDKRAKQGNPPIVQTPLHQLPAIIGKDSLQLVIVGFDYFKERVTFFRSNPHSKTNKFNKKYYEVTLGDAIHASSNAPVNYFEEYAKVDMKCSYPDEEREHKTNWFWDGAVAGFNNPVLAGLIEALTNETHRPIDEFKILSIGTGVTGKAVIVDHKYSNNQKYQERYQNNKNKEYVLSDDSRKFKLEIAKMAQSILSDPPDSATFMAYSILDRKLSNKANLVRINPCVLPQLNKETNEYELPEVYQNEEEKFKAILELDMDAVEDHQVNLIADVADKFINGSNNLFVPNQYIRGENDSDEKLGYGTYRQAKEKWLEIESGESVLKEPVVTIAG